MGTAGKVFFIMLLALLPLAIGALVSNWQSIRTAERERADLMAASTRQNADQIASDLSAIRTSTALTANVLASDPEPGNVCERLQNLFSSMAGKDGVSVVIFDRQGRSVCQSPGGDRLIAETKSEVASDKDASISPKLGGILIRTGSRDGSLSAVALYRRSALLRLMSGGNRDLHQAIVLRQGDARLPLSQPSVVQRSEDEAVVARSPLGDSDIQLILTLAADGANTRMLSLMMPLVIWLGAAFFGWLVVRSTLIEPLVALRRGVASYVPGKIMVPPRMPKLAAAEIVELGSAFHNMSENVAEHEGDMRHALDRQTRLTREVHHRVKNNLQIISSLISLHWRAAEEPAAAKCYLSIQRRVDALAVVQRNHYAELDEERGVRARPMLNEIASSLKTSAQVQSGANLDIAVDCDDVALHQDVAAPLAFMTAELADLVISMETDGQFRIALVQMEDQPSHARFALSSPAFRTARASNGGKVDLYERVLTGLSRQLRSPLGHDVDKGEYHVIAPIIA